MENFKDTQEIRCVNLAGELWNELNKVEDLSKNDQLILNESIHRIQDMLLAKLFIKTNGKL